jgi:hypothetical protein
MTANTTTLAAFLDFIAARIAEDEAVAEEAIDPARPGTHWQWAIPDDLGDPDAPRWLRTTEVFPTTSGVGSLPGFPLGFEFKAEPARGMEHIARHDPARVLADCQAKRAILDLRHRWHQQALQSPEPPFGDVLRAQVTAIDTVLHTWAAAVHSGHPDWRSEWAL